MKNMCKIFGDFRISDYFCNRKRKDDYEYNNFI